MLFEVKHQPKKQNIARKSFLIARVNELNVYGKKMYNAFK